MERIYRIILLALFVLGFVGAVASADFAGDQSKDARLESPMAILVKDIRMAQEVNDLNSGRWNQDVSNINEDGLARAEALLSEGEVSPK